MKQVSFSSWVVAGAFWLMLAVVNASFASNPNDSKVKLVAEFNSLAIEQQISLAEKTLYTDLSQVQRLLDIIIPRLASGSKNQRHRVMLIQAHLALSNANVTRTETLLKQVQLDNPRDSTLVRLLYLRARTAEFLGDYVNAFSYLNKADQLPKDQISTKNQFFLLRLAADLNAVAGRYDAALSYTEQSIALAHQLDDIHLICSSQAGMPKMLVDVQNFRSLEIESTKAIKACEKSDNKVLLAGVYQDFSHLYLAKGNYKLQQKLLNRVIDMLRENASEVNIPSAQLLLVNSYIADKQLKLAESLLDELFEYVAKNWGESQFKLLYLAKSSLLQQQGSPQKALHYYKKYLSMEQQQRTDKMLIFVAFYQAQFDSKINTQVVQLSDIEQQYTEGVSKVGRLQVWLLIIGAALFLSLPMYGLSFYHRRKKIFVIEEDQFDDLTSVYHFEQGLEKARVVFESTHHHFEYYAVASIDIDLMKAINNSFDFDFGDRLIRAFAMELKKMFVNGGIITRTRRNDFVIFFPTNDQTEIKRLLTEVHLHLRNLIIDDFKPQASCSIGYAVTSDTDIAELCNHLVGQASIALHLSKFYGGDRSTQYNKKLLSSYTNEQQAINSLDTSYDDNPAEPF